MVAKHHVTSNSEGREGMKSQNQRPQTADFTPQAVKALIDVKQVLFPRFLGVRKALLHAFFDH